MEFSCNLIRRFIEETHYIDLENKKIIGVIVNHDIVSCNMIYWRDGITDITSCYIYLLDIMGWFLNKIELNHKQL